jgi:hypothetical protein
LFIHSMNGWRLNGRSGVGCLVPFSLIVGSIQACGQTASDQPSDDSVDPGANDAGLDAGRGDSFAQFPNDVDALPAGPSEFGDPMEWADENGWVAPAQADDRPEPPEWVLDEGLGAPGWKASTTPICFDWGGYNNDVSIWADSTGIYALQVVDCDIPIQAGGGNSSLCTKFGDERRATLQHNDGTGWRTLALLPYVNLLGGFPGGRRVVVSGGGCPAAFVDFSGKLDCPPRKPLEQSAIATSSFSGFTGVGTSAGFHYVPPAVDLYDAGAWSTFGRISGETFGAFATKDLVVAVGLSEYAAVRVRGEGTFTELPDVPTGDYLAAWASSRENIWMLNGGGQLVHYTGGGWEEFPTSSIPEPGSSVWGDELGNVYYKTERTLGRWTVQQGEQVLINFMDDAVRRRITGFAPVTSTEIFVAITDDSLAGYRCGGSILLWFDGNVFHRF